MFDIDFFIGKYIDIEPIVVTLNSYQVIAASKNNFIVWHYKTPKSVTGNICIYRWFTTSLTVQLFKLIFL